MKHPFNNEKYKTCTFNKLHKVKHILRNRTGCIHQKMTEKDNLATCRKHLIQSNTVDQAVS